MIVLTFVRVWLSSSYCDRSLRRLDTTILIFSSSLCDVYLCLGDSDKQSIYDQRQKSNQWSLIYYRTEVKYIIVIIVISNV